ncbi:MAG: hypothetical protein WCP30_14460 [Mycobacteriaceae bacterium]
MRKLSPREGRTWPAYIFGGRMRTSTLVLIIAFLGVGWLYETYQPPTTPDQIPASEVVPPGFIPDPAYTWAPRTDVQRHTPTTTPTTTSTTPTTPTTPTSPAESSAPLTPGAPTPSPAPESPSTPAPPSAVPGPADPAPSERPAAQSPTAGVPAGGATPTPEPLTR